MLTIYRKNCYNCGCTQKESNENPDCNDEAYSDHYFGSDTFYNLTPHSINLEGIGEIPSDGVLRVKTEKRIVKIIGGIPVVLTTFGKLEGFNLPPQDNCGFIWYIVSLPCAQALKGLRTDILITDDPVRDDQGRIIGCKSLGIL